MKLTIDEQKCLEQYMENPYYRDVVDNAPNEPCRDYIIHGLIHGFYAGYDPETCLASLEEGLTSDDWRYVEAKLAGNDPFLPKCVTRIREQEMKEQCRNSG